jgi:5-methylcytosine-specific restriction enzyme subunit McrC
LTEISSFPHAQSRYASIASLTCRVQLFAYCIVLGLDLGHLLYAKGNEEPAHHVVRRSGIEIICHAVDLEADPSALLDQMSELASQIAGASPRPDSYASLAIR